MLRNGLARQLIGNIPDYMGGIDILPCKGDHKKIVELIPVQGHLVDYHSDLWDFTPGFKYQRRSNLRIRFEKANPEFKNLLKDYAAQLLDSYDWKVSTASNTIGMMTGILNYAIENSLYRMFILLDTDDIINAVETMQSHTSSRRDAFSHILSFIVFIKKTHNLILPVDLEQIGRRMIYLGDKAACNGVKKHHKNVPEEFFQAIVETADKVMRDESQPFNMRMTAGMILMDTQLGLRVLEIPALEKDCIHDYVCGDGKTRHYTIYNSIKPSRADVEVIKIKTICTDILYETWKYMLKLREKGEYKDKTNFIYILDNVPHQQKISGQFPVSLGSIIYAYKTFFGRYMKPYIEKDWRGIDRVKLPNLNDGKKYSIPTFHNIRVHFATSLYRQAFPLDYIESIMSHTPQSNTYDAYYDVEDDEFRKAQQTKYTNKHHRYLDADEEFDAFLNELED